MKLKEIANRINAHLKRFEADPVINKPDPKYKTHPYYCTNGSVAGRYVAVVYIAYQGKTCLSKADAFKYLAWLDAGNVGRHYEALRTR